MELERVNENTVKVFVFPEDLEEREVNFVEMMSDQSKVEEFFFSIIDEAGIKDEFENSEVISFQVVPKRDSIEIIITDKEVSTEDMLANMSEKQMQPFTSEEENTTKELEDIFTSVAKEVEEEGFGGPEYQVFLFTDFEKLIALSKTLDMKGVQNSLYSMKAESENYFLAVFVSDSESEDEVEEYEKKAMLIYELGGEKTDIVQPLINEHGKLLLEGNALEEIKRYFK